ncbi:MAG: hypothetical protein ACK4FL_01860 [Microgenomates group bacterium]
MYFQPIINKNIISFLEKEKKFVFRLKKKINQPFNLIFLKNLKDHVFDLKSLFESKKVNNFEIFYSLKANNSPFLVKKISEILPIEASSPYETELALSNNPKKLIINYTGDLKKIISILSKKLKSKTRIYLSLNSYEQYLFLEKNKLNYDFLIRIGNIENKKFASLKTSRFGFDDNLIPEIFKNIKKTFLIENFKGLSFHVDSTSDELKREYLKKAISLTIEALKMDFRNEILDIGGGVRFNYINKTNWNNLTFLISKKIIEGDSNFFWNNYNFGIIKKDKKIFGEGSFFPYYSDTNEFSQINFLLDAEFEGEKAINVLNDLNIKLIFEMGRFILKDIGGSLFEIEEICQKNKNHFLILNGKYSEIAAQFDIIYDPILIKINENKTSEVSDKKIGYFIFGNTCLEDDIFFKRKIYFPQNPNKGDLLFFSNTIPYKTKIFNNSFINGNKEINIYFDENYQLIKREVL